MYKFIFDFRNMKRIIACMVCLVMFAGISVGKEYVDKSYKMPAHPRLLLKKGEEKKMMKQVKKDTMLLAIHQAILDEADKMLDKPLLERKKEGKRLLGVSREALKRLFDWSYAYRTTKDNRYLERARRELLTLSAFSDWNPSHFLDVAEMTLGVAIAYDWLYAKLTPQERTTIENAIIEKGLDPSFSKNAWFINAINNWNQVCHTGLGYGAIAVWEKDSEKAATVLNRSIEKMPLAIEGYAPDGAYPEGCGYWEYGTSFNVMFLGVIEKLFHTDFDLTKFPGFMRTGDYITQMCTPSLQFFAYADNGAGASPTTTALWFYMKTNNPSILYNQQKLLEKKSVRSISGQRLAPAAILWGSQSNFAQSSPAENLYWKNDGVTPVCTMRSGWESDATFLGVKLGTPSAPHAHMDVGSFVVEMDGTMWACDLGGENYNNLETNGMDIWNMSQNSDRWKVFRYSNYRHNTLTFGDKLQNVQGRADFDPISKPGFPGYVVSDLTKMYEGQVGRSVRAFSLVDRDHVVIEDCIQSLPGTPLQITWTLVTPAKPTRVSDNLIRLDKDGKTVYLQISGSLPMQAEFLSATPTRSFENQNKGITLVRLTASQKPESQENLVVTFSRQEAPFTGYQSPLK